MGTRLRHEVEDLGTLALALLLVPVVWWLLLGWRWPFSLAGHDEFAVYLLVIREIVKSGQGWASLVYRPDWLGGFAGRDTFGPFPPWTVLAGLGLAPVGVSIIATFLVQSSFGFLGFRVIADLAAGWRGAAQTSRASQVGPAAERMSERVGCLCLCAFVPSLGWRVGFGHLSIMVGLLALRSGPSPWSAAAASRRSMDGVVLVAVAALLLRHWTPSSAASRWCVYRVVFRDTICSGFGWDCGATGGVWQSRS